MVLCGLAQWVEEGREGCPHQQGGASAGLGWRRGWKAEGGAAGIECEWRPGCGWSLGEGGYGCVERSSWAPCLFRVGERAGQGRIQDFGQGGQWSFDPKGGGSEPNLLRIA